MRFVELAEKNGDGFETGISLAMQAVLVSPHFLFRVELDRRPDDPKAIRTRSASTSWPPGCRTSCGAACPTTSCSSWPARRRCASRTCWRRRSGACSRIRKARALVENFAGQWLQLRNLEGRSSPIPTCSRTFDEKLRAAMLKETELFFENVIREDRSILDFLDADFTFVNERLAKHYGIDGRQGRAVPPRDA